MPTYFWNAVGEAASYQLWVNDSTGHKIGQWLGPADAGCGAGTGTCFFTPGTALAPGGATWWIQTWSPTLGYGPWSAPLSFTVAFPGAASLISPSGLITTHTPTYSWSPVGAATSYQLWVNDSTGHKFDQWLGPDTAGCAAGTGPCSFNPGTFLATGAATWWIRTWNPVGYGPWSAPLNFTVP
jgi:hypothetical protein